MSRKMIVAKAAALLVFTGPVTAAPQITAISTTVLPRSERVIITGTGFGSAQGQSQVRIGGVAVPVARWTATRISAYAPGDLPLGPAMIQVVTGDGASNEAAVTVAPITPGDGRIAWRFRADSLYFLHRAAVSSEGVVYAQDIYGFLYAIGSDGGLRWIYNAGGYPSGSGGDGPVALGADGTIYVIGDPLGPDVQIHAVSPQGQRLWVFTDTNTQGVIAGPAVGPDGNIYFVTDYGGRGITSITPSGQLRWSSQGNPQILENGQTGAELAFGPRNPGGSIDQVYCAFDERAVAPTAMLYAFGMSGGQRFAVNVGGDANVGQLQPAVGIGSDVYLTSLFSTEGLRLRAFDGNNGSLRWTYQPDQFPTNVMTRAVTGPDGTIYVGRNLGQVHAVRPDGSQKWTHVENLIFDTIAPTPTNNSVVAGGRITYGAPGFIMGLDPADGQMLWRVDLSVENGRNNIPYSPPAFSSDGRRAYIGSTLLGMPTDGNEYCYLYAIDVKQTPPPCVGDANGDGVVNFGDITTVLSAFGNSGTPGQVPGDANLDGVVNFGDITTVLSAFGTEC